MLATAIVRHIRITPRKAGYVIATLRKRSVAQALALLSVTNRRAAKPLAKLVASAFANARQRQPDLREEDVIISRVFANQGPSWKRMRPAAFGRGHRVLKRTAHITVELEKK